MVHPQINLIGSQPTLYYFPKEQIQPIQLKKQPLPIIDPKDHKQIVVERSYPEKQLVQPTQIKPRLYNQNREIMKVNYVIPNMIIETKYIPTKFPTTDFWFNHLNMLRYLFYISIYICILYLFKNLIYN